MTSMGSWNGQKYTTTRSWFVNGNDLYRQCLPLGGNKLLSVKLDGQVRVLFQQAHNWLCCPQPAPNGRLLAFTIAENQSDVVMMENF